MQDIYQPCACGSGKKYKFCCGKSPKHVPATLTKDEAGEAVYRAPDLVQDVPALSGVDGKLLAENLFEPASLLIGVFFEKEQGTVPPMDALTVAEGMFELHHDLQLHLLQILLVMKAKKAADKVRLAAGFMALRAALEKLRYSVEKNRDWALKIADRFQETVADIVIRKMQDTETAIRVTALLREAKLPISASVNKAMADYRLKKHENVRTLPSPEAMAGMFEAVVKGADSDDPFEVYEHTMSGIAGLQPDHQMVMVAGLAMSKNAIGRDVASLFFLHESKFIREETTKFLLSRTPGTSLTPDGLRRLICARNWLPEQERPALDELIKRTKRVGVECAQAPNVDVEQLMASPFDGSGGHGIWGVSKFGKSRSCFGVFVRQGFGIRDAWVNHGASKELVRDTVSRLTGAGGAAVPRTYVNRVISYFLWVANQVGNIPGISLLQVAEAMGETTWTATKSEFADEVAVIRALADKRSRAEIIRRCGSWMGEPFIQGWFEDQPDVDAIVAPHAKKLKGDNQKFERLAVEVVNSVVSKKREVWAERLEWMALFSEAAKNKRMPKGLEFLTVADEIRNESSLTRLPLMMEIGRLSVASAQKRAIAHGLC